MMEGDSGGWGSTGGDKEHQQGGGSWVSTGGGKKHQQGGSRGANVSSNAVEVIDLMDSSDSEVEVSECSFQPGGCLDKSPEEEFIDLSLDTLTSEEKEAEKHQFAFETCETKFLPLLQNCLSAISKKDKAAVKRCLQSFLQTISQMTFPFLQAYKLMKTIKMAENLLEDRALYVAVTQAAQRHIWKAKKTIPAGFRPLKKASKRKRRSKTQREHETNRQQPENVCESNSSQSSPYNKAAQHQRHVSQQISSDETNKSHKKPSKLSRDESTLISTEFIKQKQKKKNQNHFTIATETQSIMPEKEKILSYSKCMAKRASGTKSKEFSNQNTISSQQRQETKGTLRPKKKLGVPARVKRAKRTIQAGMKLGKPIKIRGPRLVVSLDNGVIFSRQFSLFAQNDYLQRGCIHKRLPENYTCLWNCLAFVIHKRFAHPVLVQNPFEARSEIWRDWVCMLNSCDDDFPLWQMCASIGPREHAGHKPNNNIWYCSWPNEIMPFDEGVKRGFDKVPESISQKLEKGECLSKAEDALLAAIGAIDEKRQKLTEAIAG